MTITVSGSSITFPDSTTQTTAGGSGTVTSVATGNGLQGGTITTSGTLSIACPTFNSVGSYATVFMPVGGSAVAGSNYSAGSNANQVQAILFIAVCGTTLNSYYSQSLSGTWKWMSASGSGVPNLSLALACRVA